MVSKICKNHSDSLDIVVIAGAAQLLDTFTRSLLERKDILCLSHIHKMPEWVKARVLYKPKSFKQLLNYINLFNKILYELKSSPHITIHTPHLYHFESNIIANNFNSNIVILPEGLLDHYTCRMPINLLAIAVVKKFISLLFGYKYIIYKKDIRAGLKPISNLDIDLKFHIRKGHNIMILGPLMYNHNNIFGLSDNSNYELLLKYETYCSKHPNREIFYKPHPSVYDNFKVWPGKLPVHIVKENSQVELLIDKYNVGIIIGNLSSALLNVKTIFGENVQAVDFGYNIFKQRMGNKKKVELFDTLIKHNINIL